MINRSRKFTEQLFMVGNWIQQHKRFLFLSPNYVVVGLSMKDYLKHFPSRDEVNKEHQIIIDEAAPVSEEIYKKLKSRLNASKKK